MAEKKIDGVTYKVESLLAFESLILKAKLLKVLGTSMSQLPKILQGSGEGKSKEDIEQANAAAIQAFMDIFIKGNPEEMANLVKEVVEIASIQSESGVYNDVDLDRDFTGKEKAMFELCVFVLKETFSDFLSAKLLNGIPRAAQKV